MIQLERVTTAYVAAEDRMRLTGESISGEVYSLWFSQRMLRLMLPQVLQWLHKQVAQMPMADVHQSFVQQSAKAELVPQAPVLAEAANQSWLVHTVDMSFGANGVSLVFKGEASLSAGLSLTDRQLRQWLSILYDMHVRAQWPLEIWPDWLRESAQPQAPTAAVLH